MRLPNLSRDAVMMIAWLLGWIVYMMIILATVFDGGLSFVIQGFVGIEVSGLCLGGAFLLGLVFKIPALGRWWKASRGWAAGLASISVAVLGASPMLGLTRNYLDDASGVEYTKLHPVICPLCYFLLIFAVANWPVRDGSVTTSRIAR